MISREKTFKNSIVSFFVALLIFAIFVPIFGNIGFSVISLSTILVCSLFYSSSITSKPVFFLLLFIAVEFIYFLLGNGNSLNLLLYNSLFLLASSVSCVCLKYLTYKQIRHLFLLIVFLLLYTILGSFFTLLTNPQAIREYDSEYAVTTSYLPMYPYGVGEAFAFLLPILTAFCLKVRNTYLMILLIFIIIMGIVTQFMGTLATSALLSLAFCSLVLVLKTLHIKKTGNLILVVGALVLVFFVVDGGGLNNNMSIGDNTELLFKIEDIQDSYSSGQGTGQVATRYELYMQSIKVCAQNPILGLGKMPVDYGEYTPSTVSMHTALFDYWGLYGVFCLFLIFSWSRLIKDGFTNVSPLQKKYYRCFVVSMFLLLTFKGGVYLGITFTFSTLLFGIISTIENQRENQ